MTLGGGSKDEVEAGLPCVVWVLVYINKVSHSKWAREGHSNCLILHSLTKEMSCHLERAVCPSWTLRWFHCTQGQSCLRHLVYHMYELHERRGYSGGSVSAGPSRKFQRRPSAVWGTLSHPGGSKARKLKNWEPNLDNKLTQLSKLMTTQRSRVKHLLSEWEEESGRISVAVHRRYGISAGTWLSSKNKKCGASDLIV